jgi:hypothetical protein
MTPLLFVTALSLLAAADAGQTTSQPAPTAQASHQADKSGNDDPDRLICHNQAITGSRFTKRICMKRSDWSEQERRTEEQTRTFGSSAALNAGMATPPAGPY